MTKKDRSREEFKRIYMEIFDKWSGRGITFQMKHSILLKIIQILFLLGILYFTLK